MYIYGAPEGSPVTAGESFPAGIDKRSNVVWGIIEWGSVTADIDIDFSGISGIYNSSALKLLHRSRGSSTWSEVSGAILDSVNRLYSVNAATTFYEYSIGGNSVNTLPVTLLYLISSVYENNVSLEWATANELNNSGFNIERSQKENEWTAAAFIPGNGTTNTEHEYSFTDKSLSIGVYKYRLKQMDYNGNSKYFTLTNDVVIKSPVVTELLLNYPNPANPTTRINFKLSEYSHVSIMIYDISGREVSILANSDFEHGYHHVTFDGANLASGIYFYIFEANNTTGNYRKVQKLILLK